MYKDPVDIRQKEFIGVVLPDPRKEENGMFGGMMGGLLSSGVAGALTGGIAGALSGTLSGALTGGFSNVINSLGVVPSAVSMGISSLSGSSFLNFSSALTGLVANTPAISGLTNAFNTISGITNGFAGLASVAAGLGNGVLIQPFLIISQTLFLILLV